MRPKPVPKRVIGADPGRFGALCWLETAENGQTVRLLRQMPDDPDELAYLLAPFSHLSLALEQQMPMPRQGVASAGKLMHRAGVVRGVCAGLGLRVVPVWPVQWRRLARIPIGSGKAVAVALARAVPGFNAAVAGWPAPFISGAADALWVAHAGMRLDVLGKG
jgi:hypothetical protein